MLSLVIFAIEILADDSQKLRVLSHVESRYIHRQGSSCMVEEGGRKSGLYNYDQFQRDYPSSKAGREIQAGCLSRCRQISVLVVPSCHLQTAVSANRLRHMNRLLEPGRWTEYDVPEIGNCFRLFSILRTIKRCEV